MADDPDLLEIYAYIDGELDDAQRFAVESRLAGDPALAALVMDEICTRSALRLLASDAHPVDTPVPPITPPADRSVIWRRWRPGAAIGGIVATACLAGALLWPDARPEYVGYAVTTHRVAMMRAQMPSQGVARIPSAHEIEASTRIDLPALPQGWKLTDVQLFPTRMGPALLIAVTLEDGQRMSLFALKARSDAPQRPDAVRDGAQSVAYWRRNDISYALTGDGAPRAIDARAERLVRDWS